MNITSIIKESTQEYNPYWSLVLFCEKCNLRCNECYNLIDINSNVTIGPCEEVIDKNINFLHDAVVFLGGEPTIHSDLIDCMKYVKNIYNLKVKLYSNGMKPDVIDNILKEDCCDAFSIDLKGVENLSKIVGIDIDDNVYLDKIQKSVNLIIQNKKYIELRTTLWDCVVDQQNKIDFYLDRHFKNIPHFYQNKLTL